MATTWGWVGEGADKAEIWNVDIKLILELHMHLRYVQAKGAKMLRGSI